MWYKLADIHKHIFNYHPIIFINSRYDTFHFQLLLDDDVSIVDSGDNVYVWVGAHATELEKELAIERAQVIFHYFLNYSVV